MAFDTNKMQIFSRRTMNLMRSMQANLEEAARLRSIYTNEAASGADAAWDDTSLATAQEHIDSIVFWDAVTSTVDGSAAVSQTDRRSNISPWLANGD